MTHEARNDPDRARLLAAAIATQRVRPPGIVRVVSIDDGDHAIVVVTDEPEGPTAEQRPLEPEMYAAAAAAMTALHDIGVAHGDITPARIRADAAGRAVLPLPRWQGGTASTDDDVAALAALATEPRVLVRRRARSTETSRRWTPPRPPVIVGAVAVLAGVSILVGALIGPAPDVRSAASRPAVLTTVAATTDRVVDVGGHRYEVGAQGDLVVVGRWHCRADATPAVVRPRTGEVFVFSRYRPAAVATAVTRLDGVTGAGRATGPGSCDLLVVDTAAGPTTVDVSAARGAAPRPRSRGAARAP